MKDEKVQPVELTGKRWKGYQALGVVGIIVGSMLILFGSDKDGESPSMSQLIGVFITLAAGIIWAGSRIGAWWYHG